MFAISFTVKYFVNVFIWNSLLWMYSAVCISCIISMHKPRMMRAPLCNSRSTRFCLRLARICYYLHLWVLDYTVNMYSGVLAIEPIAKKMKKKKKLHPWKQFVVHLMCSCCIFFFDCHIACEFWMRTTCSTKVKPRLNGK